MHIILYYIIRLKFLIIVNNISKRISIHLFFIKRFYYTNDIAIVATSSHSSSFLLYLIQNTYNLIKSYRIYTYNFFALMFRIHFLRYPDFNLKKITLKFAY